MSAADLALIAGLDARDLVWLAHHVEESLKHWQGELPSRSAELRAITAAVDAVRGTSGSGR